MLVSFDIELIRLDQKHVGLARQALLFQRCFLSRLKNSIPKDTNMVFSIVLVSSVFRRATQMFHDAGSEAADNTCLC